MVLGIHFRKTPGKFGKIPHRHRLLRLDEAKRAAGREAFALVPHQWGQVAAVVRWGRGWPSGVMASWRYLMLFDAILCYFMLFYAILCYFMLFGCVRNGKYNEIHPFLPMLIINWWQTMGFIMICHGIIHHLLCYDPGAGDGQAAHSRIHLGWKTSQKWERFLMEMSWDMMGCIYCIYS